MFTLQSEDSSQATFRRLKVSCVPLLGNSLLTPSSISTVSKLLTDLIATLHDVQSVGHVLRPAVISYVFFPLSSILRRNALSTIPDQVIEKILIILGILCESWWWHFDETIWEQIFMLCGAILGGIDSKGKGKTRDDETKEAAASCLWVLLRDRSPEEDPLGEIQPPRAASISAKFRSHAQTMTFIPVLGQTLNSLLSTSESVHLPLQRTSLKVLAILVEEYLPEDFVPSVLPGVVSTTSKVALGIGVTKGWANGEIVAAALLVMRTVILRSAGDAVCVRHGAVKGINDLEDLANLTDTSDTQPSSTSRASPYATLRTPSWLRGTASQLHISMNALTPLVNHPTPAALLALSTFSETVLSATTLTVPQSQPLLLSILLSLSRSSFPTVADRSREGLRRLLMPSSSSKHALLLVMMQVSRDSLASLPRLIQMHADQKVEHIAGLIESVCRLGTTENDTEPGIPAIASGVGKLLGPTGGIEKWGWSLLSVLELVDPPAMVTSAAVTSLLLESDSGSVDWVPFPELPLRHVVQQGAHLTLEQMFRSMGLAAGQDCLFAVDWFLTVGQSGRSRRAVAALWCACRLLEGVGRVSLTDQDAQNLPLVPRNKRLEKLARGLSRQLCESWMDVDEELPQQQGTDSKEAEDGVMVEHVRGLVNIRAVGNYRPASFRPPASQPLLYQAICLQLLSITAGILEARFAPLLLYTLYPVLRSIVSESSLVSATGLAALLYITRSTSYASPANLLLSNFDYVLDAVSHRLSRRWLDVDATKVLVILVRLVGPDVVQKAGDVVEECFDRLDEYHGYEVIVDGLIEVLTEVVKVVEDVEGHRTVQPVRFDGRTNATNNTDALQAFMDWIHHRHEHVPVEEEETADTVGEKGPGVEPEPEPELPETPSQTLTKQIVSRSLYFLTHSSPLIRARILLMLSAAVPVLPESALLPSIHHAWPFILNRFADQEPFVVSAAASLVESLAIHVGSFMYRRIWDDIWPRFRVTLQRLASADAGSALARRGPGAVGTESAYTYSHRLYRSVLRTMTAAVREVQPQDSAIWEVILLCRRFLHIQAHEELQACALDLYRAISLNNEDAVWLALSATEGQIDGSVEFLKETKWDIRQNAGILFSS
ncbi:uncharacterized protein LAESUDRAFT_813098 [Laetiporus sulphureus 93-53]|uniref:ARM repeat-containing protein n=1 Tax=Laetiporus sulphureus 93-53 TaxID=1314785 RepID=A0A165DXT6_9APHY|nr:uncharacterized protein LAESUDRAFT_813098 [Laetiporus sulphureus 93-53]KZT05840.1 hypothetical protein LAESUDRAFT_813098 [Laetiporus sulphureus 93-53]